jgi:predicted DsbA family dithiol-disulfide isomerase
MKVDLWAEVTCPWCGPRNHRVAKAIERIEKLAESEGLIPYQVPDNKVGNTDLAHEFLAHASAQGKNREASDAIFATYFGKASPSASSSPSSPPS